MVSLEPVSSTAKYNCYMEMTSGQIFITAENFFGRKSLKNDSKHPCERITAIFLYKHITALVYLME